MAKAIHMMVRVRDLDRSLDFYRSAFALEPADRFEFESFTLVYLRNAEAEFELELTANKGRDEPYQPGDGYGHLAFCVADLDGTRERLAGAGIEATAIKELAHDGRKLARFFFITDPDGYKLEVLERHGRYR